MKEKDEMMKEKDEMMKEKDVMVKVMMKVKPSSPPHAHSHLVVVLSSHPLQISNQIIHHLLLPHHHLHLHWGCDSEIQEMHPLLSDPCDVISHLLHSHHLLLE